MTTGPGGVPARRRRRLLVVLAAAALAVVLGVLALTTGAGGRGSRPDEQPRTTYLALGDSLAAGYQPDAGDDPSGGYPGHVLQALRHERDGADVRLVNLACSGETTTTFVDGGLCRYPQGSQLDAALAELSAPGSDVDVITVDLGANDVTGCVGSAGVDDACADAATAQAAMNLRQSLTALRQAAPSARIVVLNYYNPFLAGWLYGPGGQQLARASNASLAALNAQIAAAAQEVDARVADVSAAFATDDFTVRGNGLPVNVATVCELTWMCERADIHTNDAGNEVLAAAVLETLDLPVTGSG